MSQDSLSHLQSPDIKFPNFQPPNLSIANTILSTTSPNLSYNYNHQPFDIPSSTFLYPSPPSSNFSSSNLPSHNLPSLNHPSTSLPPHNLISPHIPYSNLPSPSRPSPSRPSPSLLSAPSRSTHHPVLLPTMGSIDGFTFSDMFNEPCILEEEDELSQVWDKFVSSCSIL